MLEVGCTILVSCIASRSSSTSCIWFMSRSPHEKIIFQKHSYSPWRDRSTAQQDLDTLWVKYKGVIRLHNLESDLRLRLMNDLHFVCLEYSPASLVVSEPRSTASPITNISALRCTSRKFDWDSLLHLPGARHP